MESCHEPRRKFVAWAYSALQGNTLSTTQSHMSRQANPFLLLVSGCFKVAHYANDESFPGCVFLLTSRRKAECRNVDFLIYLFFSFRPWLQVFSLSTAEELWNILAWTEYYLRQQAGKMDEDITCKRSEMCADRPISIKNLHLLLWRCVAGWKSTSLMAARLWETAAALSCYLRFFFLHSRSRLMGCACYWTILPLDAKLETRSWTPGLSDWRAELKDGISAAWN